MKLKKGDEIVVLVGKDKGRKGKIEKIFPQQAKVLVTGINVYKKHVKPQGEGKPGGVVDVVKPLAAAKVALICPKCGQKTRIGYQIISAKGGSTPKGGQATSGREKKRICRKCQIVI